MWMQMCLMQLFRRDQTVSLCSVDIKLMMDRWQCVWQVVIVDCLYCWKEHIHKINYELTTNLCWYTEADLGISFIYRLFVIPA